MNTERKSAAGTIILAGVLSSVLLAAYVAGYFGLANSAINEDTADGVPIIWRSYRKPWHWVFAPAAYLESWIRGCRVNCQEYPV